MPVAVGIMADSYNAATGPWTPASLTNLIGWWDASVAGSFTFSSGSNVSQWNDLSGNGRHMVAANNPTRTATLNSLSGVANNANSSLTYDAGSDAIDLSPWTCWAVITWRTSDSGARVLSSRQSSTGALDQSSPNALPLGFSVLTSNVTAISAGTTSAIATGGTTPMIIGSRMTGSQVFARVGSTETAATAASAPTNQRYLRIGGQCHNTGNPPAGGVNNNFVGDIFELFICNADVTATNAITYLQAKWGL